METMTSSKEDGMFVVYQAVAPLAGNACEFDRNQPPCCWGRAIVHHQ